MSNPGGETLPRVHVHILKTAGTRLRQHLFELYGRENVFITDLIDGPLIRADRAFYNSSNDRHRKISGTVANISPGLARVARRTVRTLRTLRESPDEEAISNASLIIGHFKGDRFEQELPPEQTDYTSVIQDPWLRLISAWRYFSDRGVIDPTTTPIDEYIERPRNINYQTEMLAIDTNRFAVIGTVAHLGAFAEEAGFHGFDPTKVVNATAHHIEYPEDTPARRSRFEELNGKDMELFTTLTEYWQGN